MPTSKMTILDDENSPTSELSRQASQAASSDKEDKHSTSFKTDMATLSDHASRTVPQTGTSGIEQKDTSVSSSISVKRSLETLPPEILTKIINMTDICLNDEDFQQTYDSFTNIQSKAIEEKFWSAFRLVNTSINNVNDVAWELPDTLQQITARCQNAFDLLQSAFLLVESATFYRNRGEEFSLRFPTIYRVSRWIQHLLNIKHLYISQELWVSHSIDWELKEREWDDGVSLQIILQLSDYLMGWRNLETIIITFPPIYANNKAIKKNKLPAYIQETVNHITECVGVKGVLVFQSPDGVTHGPVVYEWTATSDSTLVVYTNSMRWCMPDWDDYNFAFGKRNHKFQKFFNDRDHPRSPVLPESDQDSSGPDDWEDDYHTPHHNLPQRHTLEPERWAAGLNNITNIFTPDGQALPAPLTVANLTTQEMLRTATRSKSMLEFAKSLRKPWAKGVEEIVQNVEFFYLYE